MTTTMSDTPHQAFLPNEAWIESFTNQCNDALRIATKHFAMRRLRGVGKVGGHVDDYAAQELVQDAIDDTLFGVLAWDPTAKSLRQHLEDAIHSRTRHDYNRAKRYRHARIDAFDRDSEGLGARGELEASLQQDRDDVEPASAIFASEVIEQVRELAADDKLVLRFLDALVAGARSRADILHFTKMSLKTYRNARARLRRLVEQLDNQTVAPLRKA